MTAQCSNILPSLPTVIRSALRRTFDSFRCPLRPHSTTTSTSTLHLDQHDYNRLMIVFSESGDSDAVLRLLRRMKQTHCPPNVQCYTTVIKSLLSSDRLWDAEQIFQEMLDSGVSPDLHAYTLLIKIYSCYQKRSDLARDILHGMENHGYKPDVVAYSTYINGLCREGRVSEALDVFVEMLERKCEPNEHTFAPLIKAYCSNGNIEDARKLIGSMGRYGCRPDGVIYNILIQGLCKIGDFDAVDRVIEESLENNWEPDAITYSTYIAGLCNLGKAEKALEILGVMLDKGLKPTTLGLNILLECLGNEINVSTTRALLERCEDVGFEVDIVSYNTVMSQLTQKGRWVDVLNLFTDLFKKGPQPDTQTFNIVVSSLCKAGEFDMAKFIFGCRGFAPNVVTCNILIHEFYSARKENELWFLFSYMDTEKIAPNMITYTTLVDCLCRNGRVFEAINFVRSIENGYPVDPVARLTYWLVRSGRVKEMLSLMEEMLAKGLVLEKPVFDKLIKGFCKKGSCDERDGMSKVGYVLDKMLGLR